MSRELIESIISNNMLEANDMVEAKLAEIRERKICEMKRMYAAKMDEALGAMSKTEFEFRKNVLKLPRASAPKEKGGLGLSSYDKAQEKIKERAARAKQKVSESMGDKMSGKDEEDKFEGKHPTYLKKDPRLRTLDRFKKNLERYDTLVARGSKTADARMRKIARGYAGKLAKNVAANVGKGAVSAVKRAADSPFSRDVQDIGFRNL